MEKICITICEYISVKIIYDIVFNDAVLLFCDGFPKSYDDKAESTVYLHIRNLVSKGGRNNGLSRYTFHDRFECLIGKSSAVYRKEEKTTDIYISTDDLVGSSDKINFNLVFFLLTEVLTRLLIEQGFYAYHASSVCINGQAIVFMGESMSGKTTLSLKLADKGYSYLGDDRVFIRDGLVYSYPKPLHISHDVRRLFDEEYTAENKKGKSFVPYSKYIKDPYRGSHAEILSIFLIRNEEQKMERTSVKNIRGRIYGLNSLFYCKDELADLLDSIIDLDETPVYTFKNNYCDAQVEEINIIIKEILRENSIKRSD